MNGLLIMHKILPEHSPQVCYVSLLMCPRKAGRHIYHTKWIDKLVEFFTQLHGDYNANKLCMHEIHIIVLKLVFCGSPGFPVVFLLAVIIKSALKFAFAFMYVKVVAKRTFNETWTIINTLAAPVVPYISIWAGSRSRAQALAAEMFCKLHILDSFEGTMIIYTLEHKSPSAHHMCTSWYTVFGISTDQSTTSADCDRWPVKESRLEISSPERSTIAIGHVLWASISSN